jgi:hypothetical protein
MRMTVEPKITKSFREYMAEQPLERQREIRESERQFLRSRRTHGAEGSKRFVMDPITEAFEESFYGYEDPPAGPNREKRMAPAPGIDNDPEV